MSETLLSIPSALFAFTVLPYVDSDDLLALRAASTRCHAMLHDSIESDEIWRQRLVRDFCFDEQPTTRTVNHLDTLRTKERRAATVCSVQASLQVIGRSKSIFGYSATDGVFRAPSTFVSWKHWRKASLRYYELPVSLPRDKVIPKGRTERTVKRRRQRNLHGPYFLRAAAMWSKVEQFCSSLKSGRVGQRVIGTLKDGLSFFDWKWRPSIRSKLGDTDLEDVTGLLAVQAVYAFYGGQDLRGFVNVGGPEGLIDCDTDGKTRLLNVNDSEGLFRVHSDLIPIAASVDSSKIFSVRIWDGRLVEQAFLSDPVPVFPDREMQLDSILIWLEELARRLHVDLFDAGKAGDEKSQDLLDLFAGDKNSQELLDFLIEMMEDELELR